MQICYCVITEEAMMRSNWWIDKMIPFVIHVNSDSNFQLIFSKLLLWTNKLNCLQISRSYDLYYTWSEASLGFMRIKTLISSSTQAVSMKRFWNHFIWWRLEKTIYKVFNFTKVSSVFHFYHQLLKSCWFKPNNSRACVQREFDI